MSWVALDDQFGRNRKTAYVKSKGAKGMGALGCLTLLWSWAGANSPDGWVPHYVPQQEAGQSWRSYVEILESVGFLDRGRNCDETGWWIHDFRVMNPNGQTLSDARDALSEKRREAGKRGASARWQTDGKTDFANGKADGKPMASALAIAMAPDPNPVIPPIPPQRGGDCNGQHDNCRPCGTTRRQQERAAKTRRPDWCGNCDKRTRLVDYDTPTPGRCPACHPLAASQSA